VFSHRSDVLSGIIDGVDYQRWNPATDRYLAANYDVDSFMEGKAACKRALRAELGLSTQTEAPLVGLVGRLASQKGYDLIVPLLKQWLVQEDVQWAILGKGEKGLERQLKALAGQHHQRVAVHIGFSDQLAHRIEAGADIFLMPSRYEPCGLNQLYSLKYGAVPVVRRTGGLADTVTDTTDETLAARTATGFSFGEYSTAALSDTLQRACLCYARDQDVWRQIVSTGMRQVWSWTRSARHYADLYERTIARRRSKVIAR
jgi:starch synthase